MSSIYEHLSKVEAEVNNDIAKKLPKIAPAPEPKLPPVSVHHKPRLFGFKLLIMFALIFSVGSAAASVYFFQAMNKSQEESRQLEQRLQSLTVTTQGLTDASAEASDALIVMRTDFEGLSGEAQSLRSTLNRTRLEMSSVQQKVTELQGRSGVIESEIERIKQELFIGQKAQPVVEETVRELPRVVATPVDVEQRSADAEIEQNEVISAEEAVTVDNAAALPPVRVMTINRKFNFVVVNAGLKDDLRMGDRLNVQRGNESIARVEVEKIYEDFSAATIVNEKKNFEIQEGDAIVLS